MPSAMSSASASRTNASMRSGPTSKSSRDMVKRNAALRGVSTPALSVAWRSLIGAPSATKGFGATPGTRAGARNAPMPALARSACSPRPASVA